MMGWLRRFGGPVRWETPPREPGDDLGIIPGLFPEPAADRDIHWVTQPRPRTSQDIVRDVWFAVDRVLAEEAAKGRDHRDPGRTDLALEIRNLVVPPRGAPPVPVIPGRKS
jgi:hypothetical protein